MNLTAKFFFSIGLPGLLCLMLPGSLRADTVYTYTGNPYTECSGIYVTSTGCLGAMSLTFAVKAGTPLTDLPYTNITADVSTFSFSDGTGRNVTRLNAVSFFFAIATDAGGHITTWATSAATAAPVVAMQADGSYSPMGVFDFTNVFPLPAPGARMIGAGDDRFGAPGVWTGGATTPEPSTYLLLVTGLLGLMALAAPTKRHTPPISC